MALPPPSIDWLVDNSDLIVAGFPRRDDSNSTRLETSEILKGSEADVHLLDVAEWHSGEADRLQVIMIGSPRGHAEVLAVDPAYSVHMWLRQVRRLLAGFAPIKPADRPGFLAHEADVVLQGSGLGRADDHTVTLALDTGRVLKGDPGPTFLTTIETSSGPRQLRCINVAVHHDHIAGFENADTKGIFFLSKGSSGELATITDGPPWTYSTRSGESDLAKWLAAPKPATRRPPERSRYDHGQENAPPPPPGPAPE